MTPANPKPYPAINARACIGCGSCESSCPAVPNVFVMLEGMPQVINPEACIDCGACAEACPVEAVNVG